MAQIVGGDEMIDLTIFFEVIVSLAVTLITTFLIPYLKSKVTQSEYDKFVGIAQIAVMAAEEMERAGYIDKSKKYEYVKEQLEKHGCTYDAKKIEALINGEVWNLINNGKEDKQTDVQ